MCLVRWEGGRRRGRWGGGGGEAVGMALWGDLGESQVSRKASRPGGPPSGATLRGGQPMGPPHATLGVAAEIWQWGSAGDRGEGRALITRPVCLPCQFALLSLANRRQASDAGQWYGRTYYPLVITVVYCL